MMRPVLLLLPLALSACEREPSAAEQAAADARDIAMVEAAQERHPPIQPISLQPITVGEIGHLDLLGSSCAFAPRGDGDPVLLAFANQAVMLIEGRPTVLASDNGGQPGPIGTWQRYVGKALSLRLTKAGGDGVQAGADALEWPGELTVRDEFNRIVYTRSGQLRCGR